MGLSYAAMKSRPLGLLALTVTLGLATTRTAHAVWPPAADATQADLADPSNWPNDPGYGLTPSGGGQWNLWSWVPAANLALPGFRMQEAAMGTGNHIDAAWGLTIGDPRVHISVVDSGIEWDQTDIQYKVALNTGELPMPMGATSYDANGDGVVNVQDYANDPRIPCGTTMPRDLRTCVAADGTTPNDPNGNGIFDAGDLIRVFSDGTDGDHNGYVDDIAGWDFFHDDNDPADDTRYGHGSGEARDSAAETNNGIGDAGVCPRCMFIPLRAGDSFITDVDDFAQAVVYAVDNGVSVVQEALGTIDNSTFAMRAIDYAYAHGAVVIASAADENSRHHNVPGTNNHTLYVHAIRYNRTSLLTSTSFLAFNNCSNYGAQLALSVAGSACSSEATGKSAGMAGLIYSEALATSLSPALSSEEVRQLLVETADVIYVPEAQPSSANYDPTIYPSLPGWSQRFGYGRTNARSAVQWVHDGKIPPEVDITSPRWFTVLNPGRPADQTLTITGSIAARRAPSFDYTIEWAPGVEPADTDWHTLGTHTASTAPVTGTLASLNLTSLTINNPGEVENQYSITVRIRATAHYGGTVGDVPGEQRRLFYVHRDPTILPGWPVYVSASGESSPHTYDLNGDGAREVIYATADGIIHAFRADGTDLPGWPVHTGLLPGFDPTATPSYVSAPGYTSTTRAIDPSTVYEPVTATPGIADLDGDGHPEVVINGYHGHVYVFRHDGTAYGHGFPYALPDVPSAATDPQDILQRGIFGSPVLYDIDGDHVPEIIFGAFDGKLYALDALTAAIKPGYPVLIHFPEPGTEHNRIFGSVGIGDFNGDHVPEIVVVSNEKLNGDRNVGAAYIVWNDGNNHPGGPYFPNWPVSYGSFDLFPLVGEGLSSSPAIADTDGDGRDELALTGSGNATVLIARGVQPAHVARPAPTDLAHIAVMASNDRGALSNYHSNIVAFINAFAVGAFGDLDNDGTPDYSVSGASIDLALNLAGGGTRRPFDHLVGAWSGHDGSVFPGFPQVIEDYTFFVNPAIADVNNDGYAETILGTGGYYVHAFDACGREPTGWPKFTGQWIIPSGAVVDLHGTGEMDVVTGTRGGYLWAWRTDGNAHTGSVQWEGFRHDAANTGNWGTPLTQGVRRVTGVPTIVCPVASADAGTDGAVADASTVPDGGTTDASMDSSVAHLQSVTGGCGCRVGTGESTPPRGGLYALALALTIVRRRRRVAS